MGKIFQRTFWTLGGFLTVGTVLCLLGGTQIASDRCLHFRCYWAVLAGVLALWAWRLKLPRVALAAAGLTLLHAWPMAQLWRKDPTVVTLVGPPASLTVVSANLYAHNRRQPEAVAQLLALDGDVIFLMEVSPQWKPALQGLLQKYPYQVGLGDTEWLLSRVPWQRASATYLKPEMLTPWRDAIPWKSGMAWCENTLVQADFTVQGKSIRVVGLHPALPSNSARLAQQFAQARIYAAHLGAEPWVPARVLIGDFNTTPFAAVLAEIAAATGLRNGAAGNGYHPTWGPRLPHEPWLPWLGIPIDHTLVSPQVQVTTMEVGAMPGSDHRWQRVKLNF